MGPYAAVAVGGDQQMRSGPGQRGDRRVDVVQCAHRSQPTGGLVGGSGTSTTGGLASTGAQVAVIGGIAVVALLVGGGAVFFVRRRRTVQ
ncbi:hypothetical protein GCM10023080_048580 [Streptomyces pseudoechinosporeus]